MPETIQDSPRTTQTDRIETALRERANQWVPMPLLARIGADSPDGFCMVHSRVSDLRKHGLHITQKNDRVQGRIHSNYMLVLDALSPSDIPQ